MKIVVLGANGQLGKPVLQQLLSDYPHAHVVGCVRAKSMASMQPDESYVQHLLSFDPFAGSWAILGKVDVLINCIGIIEETAALSFEEAHVGLTERMLSHRTLLGHPKLIQISALGADTGSSSKFLSTKAQADDLLLKSPDSVILRPSIVCTPGTMLSKKLQLLQKLCKITCGVLPFPKHFLQTKLQPLMIDDLTELVSRLCLPHAPTGVIEVGGKEIYTLRQLLAMVPACKYVMPIPMKMYESLLPIVAKVFPELLDKEQQTLLQQDNLAELEACEQILGRDTSSTKAFWKRELNI